MKNKRESRIGETRKNKQGFTMRIIKYVNSKNIVIEFVETGEQRIVRYIQFVNGTPTPNLAKYPPKGECTFAQAKIISVAIITLILTAIGGVIYFVCK